MTSKEFTDWLSGFLCATHLIGPDLNQAQVAEILEGLSEVHDENHATNFNPTWSWTGNGIGIDDPIVPYNDSTVKLDDNGGTIHFPNGKPT